MTTKVLVVNYGPEAVEVLEMHRRVDVGMPDIQSPSPPTVVQRQSQNTFYVHDSAYLVVKEKKQ